MKIQTDTDMVEIKAVSRFLPDQSDLPENRYVFAYHITITNRSEQTVKLLTATGSSPTPRTRCRRCAARA